MITNLCEFTTSNGTERNGAERNEKNTMKGNERDGNEYGDDDQMMKGDTQKQFQYK